MIDSLAILAADAADIASSPMSESTRRWRMKLLAERLRVMNLAAETDSRTLDQIAKELATDLDFAIDLTEPRDVIRRRFEEIILAALHAAEARVTER